MRLLINFDETGLPVIPVPSYTLAEKGSKDVSVTGLKDRRQITAVPACTPLGELLHAQLLYQGTTQRCHPPKSVSFPPDWDIWHSESHMVHT